VAIVHFAYLFNSTEFQHEVAPLIPQLDVGNYQALRQKAWQVTQQNPHVWEILGNHFYGPDNFLSEYEDYEDPSTSFWFLVILAQFFVPIPSFDLSPTWRDQWLRYTFLRSGLALVGWEEEDCAMLITGMSTCSLILPDRMTDSVKQQAWVKSDQEWEKAHWCDFQGGWLDKANISRLLAKLYTVRDKYLEIEPQLKPLLLTSGMDITQYGTEKISELLQTSYNDAERLLKTTQEADKCLFMLIS
jgi:hypothetical protein